MIIQKYGDQWIIRHAGRVIAAEFASEAAAWSWADENIDDQVHDGPNTFSPPLVYRDDPPTMILALAGERLRTDDEAAP